MEWLSLAVGTGGLVASVIGLIFAFLARRAARSAEQAANEARHSISQTLCLVSAQRALSVIVRLNTLHREQSWEAALELYRELRTLLNDISGMMPPDLAPFRAEVDRGIEQLSVIESLVSQAIGRTDDPGSFQVLSEFLNAIQTTPEALVSSMMPPSGKEGSLNGELQGKVDKSA